MIPWPQGRDGQQTPKVRSRLIRQKAENENEKNIGKTGHAKAD
jgi:hypothetical protein